MKSQNSTRQLFIFIGLLIVIGLVSLVIGLILGRTSTAPADVDTDITDTQELTYILEPQEILFPIVDLELQDGGVLTYTVEGLTGEVYFQGEDFVYDPTDVVVTSEGDPYLVLDIGEISYTDPNADLLVNLYAVFPDSDGNTIQDLLGELQLL